MLNAVDLALAAANLTHCVGYTWLSPARANTHDCYQKCGLRRRHDSASHRPITSGGVRNKRMVHVRLLMPMECFVADRHRVTVRVLIVTARHAFVNREEFPIFLANSQ